MLVAIVILGGCEKENKESDSQSVVGRWELRHILGVQIPNMPADYGKGNGRLIEFTDTEYKYIENGKVTYTEKYRLANESMEIDGTRYERVFYAGKNDFKNYFKITGKKIMISNGTQAADGTTRTYERL